MKPEPSPHCGLCATAAHPARGWALQALGLCPALAVTDQLDKALAVAAIVLALCVVLPLLAGLLRPATPPALALPVQLALAAALVAAADLALKAFAPNLSLRLGPYVLLIAVNGLAVGRPGPRTLPAAWEGLRTGFAYALLLAAAGAARELLGAGTILGRPVAAGWFEPNRFLLSPAGAFLTLAALLALANLLRRPEETP